jgi:hypothetical protein
MKKSRYSEGQKRTCPYCGQAATFSLQARVPGTETEAARAPDHREGEQAFRPGWICENRHCWKRLDLDG